MQHQHHLDHHLDHHLMINMIIIMVSSPTSKLRYIMQHITEKEGCDIHIKIYFTTLET